MKKPIKPNGLMHYPAWLAPNGDLYSCPDGVHLGLSRMVVRDVLHLDSDNPELELEKLNWLKIKRDGTVLYYLVKNVTQQQVDTLIKLFEHEHEDDPPNEIKAWICGDKYIHGSAESWNENLKSAIRHISVKYFTE